jgi:hypothetical protein
MIGMRRSIVLLLLVFVAGLVATIALGAYLFYLPAFPDIRPTTDTAPQASPAFAITNRSRFFTLHDVRWTCHTRTAGRASQINLFGPMPDKAVEIEPRQTVVVRCELLNNLRVAGEPADRPDMSSASGLQVNAGFLCFDTTLATPLFPWTSGDHGVVWNDANDGWRWGKRSFKSRCIDALKGIPRAPYRPLRLEDFQQPDRSKLDRP